MKFAVGFFLLLFFSSCHNKFDNKALKIFKYNESSGINTLDPIFAKDQATIWVANQLFNGLVQLDNNLNVIPSIAKNWVVSKGGVCYTFTLRDDVLFHDHNSLNLVLASYLAQFHKVH